jgi:uncharacterized protein YbjT (DUF2867 family)
MGKRDVIVLGGTGFLGTRVVRALRRHGCTVGAATRFPDKLAHPTDGPDPGVRLVQVDIRDRATLTRALKQADAVINCVGLYIETRTESFRDVHVEGARRVAEVIKTQSVRNLVHISGIAADLDSPSAYVRARAEGEDAVRRAFPAATILRPSAMFSRDGAFFGDLDAIIRRLPVVPLFGDGSTRLQPVYVGDVADAVCGALERDNASGRVFELGGPDVFTYREILERLATRSDRRRLFPPMPFALWQTLAAAASLLPRPPVTPGQIALMRRDNLVGEKVATFADLAIVPQSAIAMGLV